LAEAIAETAKAHQDTCDLKHLATPSAALAIMQINGDSLQYMVLGDVALVMEKNDGPRIVSDDRVNAIATIEREADDALPTGSRRRRKPSCA
jgi:hypothetical protein